MEFTGIVKSRSTSQREGPPGESEILMMNPGRERLLKGYTGWDKVFPGSLNLKIDPIIFKFLSRLIPAVIEPGSSIIYPQEYKCIPLLRVAYLYFNAVIKHNNQVLQVLIRIPYVPASENYIEVFAAISLRETLGLNDDDIVTCNIH